MIKILISLILLILPVCVVSADSSLNAGFVSGIWYSDTKFFAGDDIRIYSALQNRSGYDIQGEVSFYVDNELIDTTEFSALSDRLIETWSDWKAIDGDHVVKVEISHIERLEVGSFPEIVNVSSNNYLEDSVFVDIDTDGDGQGDTDDDDDDNDGLSDLEEGQIGSDPKKVDTDEDGINDGDDPDPLVPLSEDNDIATDTSSEDIFMEVAQDTISEIVDTIDRFVDSQAEQVIAKKEEISREIIQAQIHQPVPSPGGGGDSPIKKKAKKIRPFLKMSG